MKRKNSLSLNFKFLPVLLIGGLVLGMDSLAAPAPSNTTGVVKVVKKVVNANGGTKTAGDFTLHLNYTDTSGNPDFPSVVENFAGSSSHLSAVGTGHYTITEDAAAGYTASYSGDCDSDIELGQFKTCTVTNSDQPATLTVKKHVVNDNSGTKTAGDFSVHVKSGGSDVAGSPASGSETGVTYTLPAGAYAVSEADLFGYAQSFGGDCDSSGNVNLNIGESKTCVITGDDPAPSGGGGSSGGDGGGSSSSGTTTSFTLTVLTSGEGQGTVTGSGINCDSANPEGSDCAETYSTSTEITLTAAPKEGSNFNDTWLQGCSGNNPVCTLTISGDTTINAHFSLNPVSGSGGGSSSSGGSSGGGGTSAFIPTTVSGGSGGSSGAGSVLGESTSLPFTGGLGMPQDQGQVLGASTGMLPRTGLPLLYTATLAGAALLLLNRKFKIV